MTNLGSSDIADARMVDRVPAGLSITGVTPADRCVVSAQTVTCDLPLASGAHSDIAITTKVESSVTDPQITNTATGSCPNAECREAVASGQVSVAMPTHAVIVIDKWLSNAPRTIDRGTRLEYVVSAKNVGNATAGDVVLVDSFPSTLSILSLPDGCVRTVREASCAVGEIAPGATVTRTLSFEVTGAASGSSIRNLATAEAPGSSVLNSQFKQGPAVKTVTVAGPSGPLAMTGAQTLGAIVTAGVLITLGVMVTVARRRRRSERE